MPPSDIRLVVPSDDQLIDVTRGIFREYARSLGIDLCFEDFDSELAGLPGPYAPPHGHLLLALVDGELAGCGAFRRLVDVDYANACEMKRLYVRPAFRRFGLGRLLAQALFEVLPRDEDDWILISILLGERETLRLEAKRSEQPKQQSMFDS